DDILIPTMLQDFHKSHPDRPAPRSRGHREPLLEEGVVSGIHHSHLHLPHLQLHRPLVHHHPNSNHLHLILTDPLPI
ncbi:hypothetical protein M9458_025766, partial [Cirrhinus mrigala]